MLVKTALIKLKSSFSPRTAAEIDIIQDRRDDRPSIYQYTATDYSRGSLRQIKLKHRVEGLIEMLSLKEIMERKTARLMDRRWPDCTSRPEKRTR